MPVTPSLLLKLRETLGNEAANDLVTWVDQATARELGHIRELAELHYGRFDARLEQRLAELRADIETRLAGMDTRLAAMDTRITGMDTRIAGMDPQLAGVDTRLAGMDTRLAGMDTRIESVRGSLETRVESVRADLIKWMFIFWVGTIVPLAGLMVALVKL
jgi:hypothetical protein